MYRHSIRLFLAAVGTATLATAMDPGMPVVARVRIVPSEYRSFRQKSRWTTMCRKDGARKKAICS